MNGSDVSSKLQTIIKKINCITMQAMIRFSKAEDVIILQAKTRSGQEFHESSEYPVKYRGNTIIPQESNKKGDLVTFLYQKK